ncbi:MAG TPA: hypothetical protein VJH55_01110 [Candidatus Paceibacterota bacterium]
MKAKKKSVENMIEDLAVMTQNGFNELNGEMNKQFEEVNIRLDRIENLILTDHRNRLERLEDRMRIVETVRGTGHTR